MIIVRGDKCTGAFLEDFVALSEDLSETFAFLAVWATPSRSATSPACWAQWLSDHISDLRNASAGSNQC